MQARAPARAPVKGDTFVMTHGNNDLRRAFEPVTLGPVQLRNRFVKAGTFEGMNAENAPTAALRRHHVEIAAGGTAMTTLGYTSINPDGRTFEEETYICDRNVGSFRVLTDAVHAAGGKVSLQLGHCGALTRTRNRQIRKPGGPSTTVNLYGAMVGALRTRAMSEADIADTTAAFVGAARLAQSSGFDAIELHMGHGYLLSQFLSPLTNRRTDRYGGSPENRARFPVVVAEQVMKAVGTKMAVLAKLNLRDGARGGVEVSDSIVTARALAAVGLHAIVMTGGFTPYSPMYLFRGASPVPAMLVTEKSRWNRFLLRLGARTAFRDMPFEELYFLQHARRMREALDLPLGLLGGVRTADNVATAMREGFDFVQMGRPLIAEPDFVRKLEQGSSLSSKCNNCNQCVAEFSAAGGLRCVLNPPNDATLNQH
ncbi:MAG: NADH:flavin oxidoreductase [Gammaproteobacteria bacterium]|nr:NADH:flavin oxidoreductase [Gammaproteobacteria bacterium]